MKTTTSHQQILFDAIQRVNQMLSQKEYHVEVASEKIEPKEPIALQIKYTNGTTRKIGVTHLVHLKGSDWDNTPYEKLARNTDELVQAILNRVDLFLDAEVRKLYMDENGTIFDFKDIAIVDVDHTFSINGKKVIWKGTPLPLTRLRSEGVIEFKKRENGVIELFDTHDQREQKGMFVNALGELYRA